MIPVAFSHSSTHRTRSWTGRPGALPFFGSPQHRVGPEPEPAPEPEPGIRILGDAQGRALDLVREVAASAREELDDIVGWSDEIDGESVYTSSFSWSKWQSRARFGLVHGRCQRTV